MYKTVHANAIKSPAFFQQSIELHCFYKLQWSSPRIHICLSLTNALWMSRIEGRLLSRSDLNGSLRCGWLFVIAAKILQHNTTDSDDKMHTWLM